MSILNKIDVNLDSIGTEAVLPSSSDEIREQVQEFYAGRARDSGSCCSDEPAGSSYYESAMLSDLPGEVAEFSLGCGDPITLAELQAGETVLDLGSGGGLDCFLAAREVGETGRVIGIDMTPEMLAKARAAGQRLGLEQVDFRRGYLEDIPVSSGSVDVIISNCVINLAPEKPLVFTEMYRTLKPGGRVSVSDIVINGELPEQVRSDMLAWGACVAGALDMDDYVSGLQEAGFVDVQVGSKTSNDEFLSQVPDNTVFSAGITAWKPA
jgi:SAM-dependent methyltransferase